MLKNIKKLSFLLLLFLILTITLGLVSASSDMNNQTMKTNSTPIIKDNNQPHTAINNQTFEDIQNAVDNAKEGDIITLTGNYSGTGKEIKINKSLTLKGNAILDAKNLSGIIRFTGKNITINGLTFINSNNIKGAIYTTNDFIEIFGEYDPYLSQDYMAQLKISLINSTFKNNIGNHSGALYIIYYTTSILNCNFSNNTGIYAGAVKIRMANSTLNNSIFTNNKAAIDKSEIPVYYGEDNIIGAVSLEGDDLSINNCKFINNIADNHYFSITTGGLYTYGNCSVKNCYFEKNIGKGESEHDDGGAFFNFGSKCNVENSIFIANELSTDEGRGAAIHSHSPCTVLNCTFKNNKLKTHDHDGGAIYSYNAIIINSTFENNQASWAGAVSSYNLNITGCVFKDNYAKQYGGAITTDIGNINDCVFISNSAKKHGGAIYTTSIVNVKNCDFNQNYAEGFGSAIGFWSEKGSINVYNSKFTNNKANGKADTFNYPFKNYGNGAIFHLGNLEHIKCTFVNCQGIVKNSDKYKDKTIIKTSKNPKVSKGKTFKIKITDSKGNPIKGLKIKIKIKGHTYKKTTDKNGKVEVLIKLSPKTYKTKISYNGDNFYRKSSKTIKLKVKK